MRSRVCRPKLLRPMRRSRRHPQQAGRAPFHRSRSIVRRDLRTCPLRRGRAGALSASQRGPQTPSAIRGASSSPSRGSASRRPVASRPSPGSPPRPRSACGSTIDLVRFRDYLEGVRLQLRRSSWSRSPRRVSPRVTNIYRRSSPPCSESARCCSSSKRTGDCTRQTSRTAPP